MVRFPFLSDYLRTITDNLRIILMTIVCATFFNGFGNNNKNAIDSLEKLLPSASDEEKVDVYNRLSWVYAVVDDTKAISFAQQAIDLAKQLEYLEGEADGYNNLALINDTKGNYDTSLELLHQELAIVEDIEDAKASKKFKASIFNNIAILYFRRNDYQNALEYYHQALKMAKELENKAQIATYLSNIGTVYTGLGDYELAHEYYSRSLILAEETQHKKSLARTLQNISTTQFYLNKHDEGLKYLLRALPIAKEIGDKLLISNILSAIGEVHNSQERYKQAISFYHSAIAVGKEIDNKLIIAHSYHGLGESFTKTHFDSSFYYFSLAKELAVELENWSLISNIMRNIGHLYLDTGQYQQALPYFHKSWDYAKKANSGEPVNKALLAIAKCYELLGNYQNALSYHKQHMVIKDSLFNSETTKQIANIEINYKIKQKEKQIELLERNKELTNTRNLLYLACVVVIIILGTFIAIAWYRKKKSQYETEINQLRRLKSELEISQVTEKVTEIPITIGNKITLIKTNEIVCFYAEHKYVFLRATNGKKHIVDYTLASLEEKLPLNFVRVHRTYIINKDEIKEIHKHYNGKVIFQMNHITDLSINSGLTYSDNVKTLMKV